MDQKLKDSESRNQLEHQFGREMWRSAQERKKLESPDSARALMAAGHNHTTRFHPVTGRLYHHGCPACEANRKFIEAIVAPGCTQEQYDKALTEYRNWRDPK